MELCKLENYTDLLLEAARFRDYCPNGVQVEGRAGVFKLVSGVTASLDLLKAAMAAGADAILVHHGYFWKNEDARIAGVKRARLELLLRHNVSLLAYHLPLDAHPELGNNAQLAARLGWEVQGRFGRDALGMIGRAPRAASVGELACALEQALGRAPLCIGDAQRPVGRLAWCTGAAQGWIEAARAAGADTYVSGEISEPTTHFAREMDITYLACGHHASERYGVQALGARLADHFGIEHLYVELDNPA